MLNIAIIGTGNISHSHIKAYLEFPQRCKITKLVDIYPEKAEKVKQQYNLIDAEVLDSHDKLLGDKSVDLVSICTPPFCHAEIAINCLNDGKHAIVEKPMSASLEECDAMIASKEKNKKILSVIAQNRFRDPIWNLKKVLDSGKIGKILHGQINSFWWRGHCYYDLWWRGTWEKEGGGCTLNHAVHHIDMLGWMMGMPNTVSAVLSNTAHDNAEVEDISIAVMKYEKGALAQVTSSVIHHGEEQEIIFQGEHARVSAPWRAYASLSMDNGFPKRNAELEKELDNYFDALPKLKYQAHTGQIDNVMTAIEQNTEPFVNGSDGRSTIELITAIYKAGVEQKAISLPIAKDDAFYTVKGILEKVPRFYNKTTSEINLGSEKITLGVDYEKQYNYMSKD